MYLRPWTRSQKMADDVVPSVTDLNSTHWKQYLKGFLPHAARCLRSAMSACMADNADAHEDKDADDAKDVRLRGDLEVAEVHGLLNKRPEKQVTIRKSCASPGRHLCNSYKMTEAMTV